MCNGSNLDWLQFLLEHDSESGSHPSVHLHSQQLSLEEEGRRKEERERECLLINVVIKQRSYPKKRGYKFTTGVCKPICHYNGVATSFKSHEICRISTSFVLLHFAFILLL